MSSTVEWAAHRTPVIEAIRDGAAHVEAFHGPVIGPTTYESISYPYAEVLPESSAYQGGNEWEHLIRLNGYFERERDRRADHPGDAYLDQLTTLLDAVSACMDELAAEEIVMSYIPQTVEDFAGELDGTALLLISVQFRVTTLADLADT